MSATHRIGLLVPSSNTTVETEFYRTLPASVTLHVARLYLTTVVTDSIGSIVDALESEARNLASADVDIIVLGATAPSFLKGLGYDREVAKRIEDATGKPATTTSTALINALKALGASRIALGSAYTPKVNGIAASFLKANGFDVVGLDGLDLTDNLAIGRLDAQTAYDMGRRLAQPGVDAIALACTNWKSVDIIDRLEADIGKPVVSTTQVSIWEALRRVGYDRPVAGAGRLLRDYMATPATV
jgi:maleate cis-trans isomerase